MAIDPRNAFHFLMQAWEEFHAAVIDTEDADAPRVVRASERLADAYTVYDDVLFTNYGVEAPFDTYESDDDYDDDVDDEYDDDVDDGAFDDDGCEADAVEPDGDDEYYDDDYDEDDFDDIEDEE